MFEKFLIKAAPRIAVNPVILVEAAPFLLIASAAYLVYNLVVDA